MLSAEMFIQSVDPQRVAHFWLCQKRRMDKEYIAIRELKKKAPGDPSVLDREKKFLDFQKRIRVELNELPQKYRDEINRTLHRAGLIAKRAHHHLSPDQFKRLVVRMRAIGIDIEEQLSSQPARVD